MNARDRAEQFLKDSRISSVSAEDLAREFKAYAEAAVKQLESKISDLEIKNQQLKASATMKAVRELEAELERARHWEFDYRGLAAKVDKDLKELRRAQAKWAEADRKATEYNQERLDLREERDTLASRLQSFGSSDDNVDMAIGLERKLAETQKERDELAGKVEKLINAGDSLAVDWMALQDLHLGPSNDEAIEAWNKAKEARG